MQAAVAGVEQDAGAVGVLVNNAGYSQPGANQGHAYGSEQAAAWAQIAPPPGWTSAKTVQLQQLIGD